MYIKFKLYLNIFLIIYILFCIDILYANNNNSISSATLYNSNNTRLWQTKSINNKIYKSSSKNNTKKNKKTNNETSYVKHNLGIEYFYAKNSANNNYFEHRAIVAPKEEYVSYIDGDYHSQFSLLGSYYLTKNIYLFGVYDRIVASDTNDSSAKNYASGNGELRVNDRIFSFYIGDIFQIDKQFSTDFLFGFQYAEFEHKSITNYYRSNPTALTLYGESYSDFSGFGPIAGFISKYKFGNYFKKEFSNLSAFFNLDVGTLFGKIHSKFYGRSSTTPPDNNITPDDVYKLVPYFKFRLGFESKWDIEENEYIVAQLGYQFKYYHDATRGLTVNANNQENRSEYERVNFYGPFLTIIYAF